MTLGGVPVAGSAGGCAIFRTPVLVVACTLSPMASWPGGAVTVMAAGPLFPPLVAVIVAHPAPPPLTSPLPLTLGPAAMVCPPVTNPPGGRGRPHRDRRHRRDTAGDRHRRRVRRAVGMTRRRDLEAPARAAMIVAVMPPVARPHVRDGPARDVPAHRARRRIAGGAQAAGHEILILIELQRDGVGNDDQLTDGGARRRNLLGEFAAQQGRGDDGRGGAGKRPVFEPREAIGQFVSERHRNPPGIPTHTGPPTSTRVGRWRPGERSGTASAVAPWLCVTAFRRVCS